MNATENRAPPQSPSPQFDGFHNSPVNPRRRRLIVNADDFGRSKSINEAVIRAHREGVLTTASLMVNEPGCDEAVQLARENPRLGVGLHLSLLCGRSALPQSKIPGLVNSKQEFTNNPTGAGMKYFFNRTLRSQLRDEIRGQLARFRATGLPLDHVNGHLHMHLHPTVFRILLEQVDEFGIKRIRLTRDPFRVSLQISSGEWIYRFLHAFIYKALSASAARKLLARGIQHTHRVFGLLQNARVDEDYVLKLLPRLPTADSELYSHPSLDEFKHEFEALISPRVRSQIETLGIQLIRYQDL